ncbi:MAG: efflux RND transporter permease subunit [Magnetococcus sp. WYHC-3]
MLQKLLQNHVFANLMFILVLIVGAASYTLLPRQQDPDMNFNWIQVMTTFPGASAEDVEKLVTDPLEEALEKLQDVRFVQSESREHLSSILIRFRDMKDRDFDRRVTDLRREVQAKAAELPAAADDPAVLEITSANGFPTVMLVVRGPADDENLRRQARLVKKDLERMAGVDSVDPVGLRDPEIHVRFDPVALERHDLAPWTLADTLAARFRSLSGGTVQVGAESWTLRLDGEEKEPDRLGRWAVAGPGGDIPLEQVARIQRDREKAGKRVLSAGHPAVLMAVTKQPGANALELTARIREYIQTRQSLRASTGVELELFNDSTYLVRDALGVMESNALLGLGLVFITTWFFLGSRIALLVGVGVPFSLLGTFGVLYAQGESLNVMVLLGVVISLGMLVDDAVVVVESIHTRLVRGVEATTAALESLREVGWPVLTSVLTTLAAFLPLMLLPGILGKFMRVIPMVVSLALLISLVEAFWMLPAHIQALRGELERPSRLQAWRSRTMAALQRGYVRLLIPVLRRPRAFLAVTLAPMAVAVALVAQGAVRMEFFAFDPFPLFYVNLKMPAGTPLETTLATAGAVERQVRAELLPGEAEAVVAYAGEMFTDTAPLFGDRYGQVAVSLIPDATARRGVEEIVASLRSALQGVVGPENLSFQMLSGGPPTGKPVSVKVRGDDYAGIRAAVTDLKELILRDVPTARDLSDNDSAGRRMVLLRPHDDALRRAGLHPAQALRLVPLFGDGEVVASFQQSGEKVQVRVQSAQGTLPDVEALLTTRVALPNGGRVALGELFHGDIRQGMESIHHYDFRRAITVEADIDQSRIDTVAANRLIQEGWRQLSPRHPGVDLDFSGIMDDIQESLDDIAVLFILGVLLMYMILGAQFGSYFQPLMILLTVPMAFTGVVFGLYASDLPLSLYTLYGVVALSGIAVNSSIVLIAAANDRRLAGMGVLHAVVYAARRRVIPILITTLTTVAGLFSLATGLGGFSLLWGPVAGAIVWGLSVSTLLTLFLMPLVYLVFMRRGGGRRQPLPHALVLP